MSNDDGQRANPGRPKLRTSCDACGAAKLRCDRGQPSCERCVSHGVTCVYGLSRKMGKPPRQKLRHTPLQATSDQVEVCKAGELGSSTLWATIDASANANINVADFNLTLDAFDTTTQSLSGLDSFDYDDWPDISYIRNDILSPDIHFHPISPVQSPQAIGPPYFQENTGHNCARTAYDMFGSLAFFSLPAIHSGSSPQEPPSINEVPLDHVLSITRGVSEQLCKLLSCPCASNPSLALIHASIITRIFAWYHDITMSIHSASIHMVSIPFQSRNQECAKRPSSVTGTDSMTPSSFGCSSSVPISVSSSNIAIGKYNIDDQGVEAAVKIQLVLGEMRRARELNLKLVQHSFGAQHHDSTHSLESLFQNLNNWIASEHSRVNNVIKSKLRELNT